MDTCVLEFCPCTFGFERVAPQGQELSFVGWWRKAVGKVEKRRRKGFNSLIILGAWTLWIHRNKCVFYGVSPSQGYPALLRRGKEALVSSGTAGAKSSKSLALTAEATDTTFNTSVKAEQWQDLDIEPLTDLCLFITVDHKKLQSWMHLSKLMYLFVEIWKRV